MFRNLEGNTQTPSNSSRKIIDPDFHFFSDTELTSNVGDSRTDSPIQIETVQSDSEFEVKNRKGKVLKVPIFLLISVLTVDETVKC